MAHPKCRCYREKCRNISDALNVIGRRTLILGFLVATSGCTMIPQKRIEMFAPGNRYRIDTGDGDQRYFAVPLRLILVHADWFPSTVQPHGDALLLKVEGGEHDGEYIAVTAKGGNLKRELLENGNSDAIAWHVTNPTSSYEPADRRDLKNIGMTVIWWEAGN